MTYAPADLAEIRGWLVHRLDLQPGTARASDLEPGEVGIVGDPAHASTGGYHEGLDDLTRVGRAATDYSVRESPRDKAGLTHAASALDIGDFAVTVAGRQITLRSLSLAIVAACERGDPRTHDVREVIYSPDGTTVRRWDRLGKRATGDDSHRWHTHVSFFRDAEGRRAARGGFLELLQELIDGPPAPPPAPPAPTQQMEDDMAGDIRYLIKAAKHDDVFLVTRSGADRTVEHVLIWAEVEAMKALGVPYLDKADEAAYQQLVAAAQKPTDASTAPAGG